jgi:preprotein translocase subunit YajC
MSTIDKVIRFVLKLALVVAVSYFFLSYAQRKQEEKREAVVREADELIKDFNARDAKP